MLLPCKFNFGDVVAYHTQGSAQGRDLAQEYRITSVRYYQSEHYRPEAYAVSYCCEPIEYAGMEHDEEEWIAEVNLMLTRG